MVRLRTLIVGLAMVLVAAGCASGDNPNSLVLYSGRSEDLMAPLIDQFEEASGIRVEVKYEDSARLAILISEEGANSPADLFLSQSPGAIGFVDQRGLLADLPAEILDLVVPNVRDDDGRWVGISGRQRVLVYNPDLVAEAELPDSIFDLVDPAWSDRLALAPANGSFQDFITAMRATNGDQATEAWLAGIEANSPVSYPKNSAIVAAVGRGEVDAGLVNHYYNIRALEEDPNQNSSNHYFVEGDAGGVLIVTAAARLNSSERSDNADRFIRFLLDAEAQNYFAFETYEYPLVPGASPAPNVPAASFGDVGGIDYADLSGGLQRTREMIADAGLEEG